MYNHFPSENKIVNKKTTAFSILVNVMLLYRFLNHDVKYLTLAIRAAAETTATCPPGSWGDAWYASSAPSDNQDVIALR